MPPRNPARLAKLHWLGGFFLGQTVLRRGHFYHNGRSKERRVYSLFSRDFLKHWHNPNGVGGRFTTTLSMLGLRAAVVSVGDRRRVAIPSELAEAVGWFPVTNLTCYGIRGERGGIQILAPNDPIIQAGRDLSTSQRFIGLSGFDSGSDLLRSARFFADCWEIQIAISDHRRIVIPKEAADYGLLNAAKGDRIVIAAMPHAIELWNIAEWNLEQRQTAHDLTSLLDRVIGS